MVDRRDLRKELRDALQEVKEHMEGKKGLMTWEELLDELEDYDSLFIRKSVYSL